ncbi:hypothetical protein U91I_04228 [alpha proteobacterium U9-1i]|nr:hypothetical protein U91I_04228 [alpha proteobacterium U9-1i]
MNEASAAAAICRRPARQQLGKKVAPTYCKASPIFEGH